MPTTRAVTALLDLLRAGETPTAVQITSLSDLGRDDAIQLEAAWPTIDLALREALLSRASELTEDNVDLDFTTLARVALGDENAALRRRAIEALWESRDRTVASRLATLVRSDPDESVRAAAASGLEPFVVGTELGTFHAGTGDEVVAALRAAAGDPAESVDVRARATEALGARSLPWVDTLINDAHYDEDPRMRIAAVRAMGASAQERWLEFLQDLAISDDPELRFETANALGAIGSEDSIEILTDLLADDDQEVIIAALRALGEVGGDDAVERLRMFLAHAEEEPLTDAAESAIAAALYLEDPDLLRQKIGL
jgi:HEAT repeat protein